VGGSITGDNITTYHLFNVKRLAYELTPPPAAALLPGTPVEGITAEAVERVVRSVVEEILAIKK